MVGTALAVTALFVVGRQVLAADWAEVWAQLGAANPWLLGLALGVFYLTYPLRAARWAVLLGNAGVPSWAVPSLPKLIAILYRAAFVNSVGVARVGDLFRANLLKGETGASRSVALGTVVSERLLDLTTLATVVSVAALLFLGGEAATDTGLVALVGLALIAAAGVVLALAHRHRGAAERLLPTRFRPIFGRVLDGVGGSLKRLPLLIGLSLAGWALEGTTVYLVATAVGAPISPGAAIVVGLVGALLTTIPLTPSGLGFTEVGMAVLLVGLGVDAGRAAAIVLLVRLVGYWSIVLVGGLGALTRRSL